MKKRSFKQFPNLTREISFFENFHFDHAFPKSIASFLQYKGGKSPSTEYFLYTGSADGCTVNRALMIMLVYYIKDRSGVSWHKVSYAAYVPKQCCCPMYTRYVRRR